MKVSRHAVTLVAALLLAAAAPRLYAQTTRIAVVDLQRALNETEDGRRAKAKLKRLFKQRQQSLDKRQNELKALKEELDARGMMMTPEAKQERMADLQKKLMEVQQLYFTLQQELSQKEAQATSGIFAKMGTLLEAMGKEQGYTIIVEKSAVLYAKPSLDLTNELIRRYNDAYGKKKKK
jgi:outer membrane protein